MNQYLSDKIKLLSLVSIVFVLYIHSVFYNFDIENSKYLNFIQVFVSERLGRCAVPLFFVISGYLFFLKIPFGVRSIFVNIRKRFSSLFIPYLITAVFYVFFNFFMFLFPFTTKFANYYFSLLLDKSWLSILISVFYRADYGAPIAFHLWFLRDLIIVVLLTPAIFLLYKYVKWYWLLIIFFLNFLQLEHFPIYAVFWFSVGGCFVNINLKRIESKAGVFLLGFFLLLSLFQTRNNSPLFELFEIPIIAFGLLSIWIFFDGIVSKTFILKENRFLLLVSSFTFFTYLFHEPLILVISRITLYVFGKSEIGHIFTFIFTPLITFIVCLTMGMLLKAKFPKLYKVIVGGRF